MFGVTTISGVRGSPLGGIPGLLKYVVSNLSEKIAPMPATLFVAGDIERSMLTASAVVQFAFLFRHNTEKSSSVGPLPGGVDGASETGKHPAFSRMIAGRVRPRAPGPVAIPK